MKPFHGLTTIVARPVKRHGCPMADFLRERMKDGFPYWFSAVHSGSVRDSGVAGDLSFVLTVILAPVLRALTPANNDGTGVIMIPYLGIVTGAIAGSVAARIVHRRRGKVALKPDVSVQHETETSVGRRA